VCLRLAWALRTKLFPLTETKSEGGAKDAEKGKVDAKISDDRVVKTIIMHQATSVSIVIDQKQSLLPQI